MTRMFRLKLLEQCKEKKVPITHHGSMTDEGFFERMSSSLLNYRGPSWLPSYWLWRQNLRFLRRSSLSAKWNHLLELPKADLPPRKVSEKDSATPCNSHWSWPSTDLKEMEFIYPWCHYLDAGGQRLWSGLRDLSTAQCDRSRIGVKTKLPIDSEISWGGLNKGTRRVGDEKDGKRHASNSL